MRVHRSHQLSPARFPLRAWTALIVLGMASSAAALAAFEGGSSRPTLIPVVSLPKAVGIPNFQTTLNPFWGQVPKAEFSGPASQQIQGVFNEMTGLNQALLGYLQAPAMVPPASLSAVGQSATGDSFKSPLLHQAINQQSQKTTFRDELMGFTGGSVFSLDPSLAPVRAFAGGAN